MEVSRISAFYITQTVVTGAKRLKFFIVETIEVGIETIVIERVFE